MLVILEKQKKKPLIDFNNVHVAHPVGIYQLLESNNVARRSGI
jgi:hypothetical protein